MRPPGTSAPGRFLRLAAVAAIGAAALAPTVGAQDLPPQYDWGKVEMFPDRGSPRA